MKNETEILIQIVDFRSGLRFKNHKDGDAGFDLEVWMEDDITIIPSGKFMELNCGIKVKVGDNAWGNIRPRSSAIFKKKLFVMSGTIDSGYTGMMYIMVYNPNNYDVEVHNGESLAQLVPVPKFGNVEVKQVTEMPKTNRGESGFGSTGGSIEYKL